MEKEFQHMQRWCDTNKLQISVSKLKNSLLDCPPDHSFNVPQSFPFIEQVTLTKHLEVLYFCNFLCCCNVHMHYATAKSDLDLIISKDPDLVYNG